MFLNDEDIKRLLKAKKHVSSKTRSKSQRGSEQRDFVLQLEDGSRLTLYLRQNIQDPDAFSCGLRLDHGGESLTLCRYNGPDHAHRNPLEDEDLPIVAHIHVATERYQLAGLKPDKYASPTDRYKTLDEAVRCLVEDCNIQGLDFVTSPPTTRDLFQ